MSLSANIAVDGSPAGIAMRKAVSWIGYVVYFQMARIGKKRTV